MESTTIELKKGSKLYRSYNVESGKKGNWFSINAIDTYGYGNNTAEYILKKDIKLIDISKQEFYNRFTNDVKTKFAKDNNLIIKSLILFPLGFDDRVFYKEFAIKFIKLNLSFIELNPEVHIISNLSFNNRSRCSLTVTDNIFSMCIKELYGHIYDGFGCLEQFPDVLRNGFHHSEIMLFNNDNVEYEKDIERVTLEGGSTLLTAINIDNDFLRENQKKFNEYIKNSRVQADTPKLQVDKNELLDKYFEPPKLLTQLHIDNEFLREGQRRFNEIIKEQREQKEQKEVNKKNKTRKLRR